MTSAAVRMMPFLKGTALPKNPPVVRRLVLVGAQSHGSRVALVPQSTGTPRSIQDVVEDDSEAEAVVNQFDMTLVDSEDGDATNVSVPVSGSTSTVSVGVPVLHEDSGFVGGSPEDETVGVDGWEESPAGDDDDIPCTRTLWRWRWQNSRVLGRACES